MQTASELDTRDILNYTLARYAEDNVDGEKRLELGGIPDAVSEGLEYVRENADHSEVYGSVVQTLLNMEHDLPWVANNVLVSDDWAERTRERLEEGFSGEDIQTLEEAYERTSIEDAEAW